MKLLDQQVKWIYFYKKLKLSSQMLYKLYRLINYLPICSSI